MAVLIPTMETDYIELVGETAEDVLEELATYALESGYVEEPYVNALLERERVHPTGLRIDRETDPFGIAIPHADPGHVREEAVVLGLPESPVTFHSMDDKDSQIQVDAVVLLLVTDTDGYTTFLSDLTTLFQDDAFATAVLDRDADRTLELILDCTVDI